jgi:cytidine deaminase
MEKLIESAREVLKNSYSPYSKFKVGAAVLTKSGKVYSGCNVENSSYGATVCAERIAIFNAVSEGEKEFIKLAVVSNCETMPHPCGICLQVISEFVKTDIEIIISNKSGKTEVSSLKKLLTTPFTIFNV